jgi:hypothetical protein
MGLARAGTRSEGQWGIAGRATFQQTADDALGLLCCGQLGGMMQAVDRQSTCASHDTVVPAAVGFVAQL